MIQENLPERKQHLWLTVRTVLYIVGALLLFLFAIDLMVSSLQHLGRTTAETIILATSNPFTGLFIGLLITAMIQSSSTTTAMVVALVASGSITLESAVPIIMGANIGTTITSTIVSLGFISKKKEFRRAVSAGTYHDFFNILTVIILFPLEYYYGFLSGISSRITAYFFETAETSEQITNTYSGLGFDPITNWLLAIIPNGFILVVLAFALLFGSILLFRKLISNLLLVKPPEKLGRFFFQNPIKAFAWGVITTAAIRSSTITSSVVVPLVAKRVIKLKLAAPFILGANIGTTITAFIAAILYTNTASAITIAIAHFLFNFIGVLIFFPIPALRNIPIELASYLGKLTLKYRLVGLVYLLSAFFFIPFSLIYLNRDSVETTTVTYETKNERTLTVVENKLVSKINRATQSGQWIELSNDKSTSLYAPSKIYPIYYRDNVLFVKGKMLLFSKPGFCWDGEDRAGKYKLCIDSIMPSYKVLPDVTMDSVYIYTQRYYNDSLQRTTQIYLSPLTPVVLHQTVSDLNGAVETKRITLFKKD